MPGPTEIVILEEEAVSPAALTRLVEAWFGDMVKYVVDVERRVIALGGELHADAEEVLMERGSRQADIWGANYYPGAGPERAIEFTALINIRPAQGNRGMEVQDPKVREVMSEVTFALIGRGEPLP